MIRSVFYVIGNCAEECAASAKLHRMMRWFGSGSGHWPLFYANAPCHVAPLALPLGELSPQVTERVLRLYLNGLICRRALSALSVLAVLGHLSQRERQGMLVRNIKQDIEVYDCDCKIDWNWSIHSIHAESCSNAQFCISRNIFPFNRSYSIQHRMWSVSVRVDSLSSNFPK